MITNTSRIADTFPNPLKPYDDQKALSPFPIMGLGAAMEPLIKAGAAGAVIVDVASV